MDETRIDRTEPEGSPPPGHALPGGPDAMLPAPRGEPAPVEVARPRPALPEDPDTARLEIVETRARMSETIDQIEEQLLRKKMRLQEQMDVRGQLRERLSPVRERIDRQPLAAIGAVFATGLLLGLLTGGDDDDDLRLPEARERHHHDRMLLLERENELLEEEVRVLRARLDEETDAPWGGLFGLFRGRRRAPRRTEYVVEIEEEDIPGDTYHPSASYDQYAATQRGRVPGDPLQG